MNTLYYGDNLEILRKFKDETVDLIYLDPPFNSKADYNMIFKEPTGDQSEAQITAFEDTWHWNEQTALTFQQIVDTAPDTVVSMMLAFKQFVGLNDVMAYLTMMCIRLIELRRVLKDTGSIYLHCDPTASHYLKIVMDTIFGKKNFRNEIVWCYRKWSITSKQFARNHDCVLFYSKSSKDVCFNTLFSPLSEGTLKRWKGKKQQAVFDDTGIRFASNLDEESKGSPMSDWWEISIINPQAKERLGYPTQKPEELLERIIKASSNEGDIVLDPFCGCGTTIAVAQELKRNWIGIDITHLAINLIKNRLNEKFKEHSDYEVIGEPKDLAGAKDLKETPKGRYQFQWWALSLIGARPHGDKKKGSDTGIDGFLYIQESKDEVKKVIIQVKSGKVKSGDIRDLGHVIERENAGIGLFITLETPSRDMIKEATTKGYYTFPFNNQNYPRIQILTIEELLSGRKPNLPPTISSFKQAKPVVNKAGEKVKKSKDNYKMF